MSQRMMMGMAVLVGMGLVAGCATGGVRARTYVEDKERVDQDMQGGNYGYLYGQPVPENREDYKKTRKIYVLEVTKEDDQADVEPVVVTKTRTVYVESEPEPAPPAEPKWTKPLPIPSFQDEDISAPAPAGGSAVEYRVQKNDTLQKISKKFYDTYRKWPQIYEANKDVIKNPDRIKPGITIKIPVE